MKPIVVAAVLGCRGVLACMALAGALGLGASPCFAAPDDSQSTSRKLFRKAVKEYEQGKVQEAYADYRAAWELQKSYDIAGNLANVELELGHYADAVEHASFALANFPPVGTEKQRAVLVALVNDARGRVGVLVIHPSVSSAVVTVDGKPTAPSSSTEELFVEPGEHTVRATAPDYQPLEQKVRVDKGTTLRVSLELQPEAKPEPSPPPVPQAPRSQFDKVAWIGIAASGVGIAVGATLAGLGTAKGAEADKALSAIVSKSNGNAYGCLGVSTKECTALHDLRTSQDTLSNASFWTFVGAGAVAAGTVVYILASPRSSTPSTTAAPVIVPVVTPQSAGLLMQTKF